MNIKNFYEKHKDKKFFIFLDDIGCRIIKDRVITLASSQVYYMVLSIFPFLIALVNIVAITNLKYKFSWLEVMNNLPPYVEDILWDFLKNVEASSSTTLLIFSTAFGLWSASRSVVSIVLNINAAYKLPENRKFVRTKLLSFLLTIGLAFLFTVLFVFTISGRQIKNFLMQNFKNGAKLAEVFSKFNSVLFPILFMAFIFYMIYYISPNIENKMSVPKKLFLPGTFFAAIGVILATTAFSFYTNNIGSFSRTYGSLGGAAIFLIWMFLMNFILLTGGEINAFYYKKFLGGDKNLSLIKTFVE